MKTENRSFKHKGKVHSGVIVWPSDLTEAFKILSPDDIWQSFKLGYLEHCRRQICGIIRRRKTQKIDVSDLPEHEQQAILLAVEQMRQLYKQPTKENAPLVQQPTAPTDSDETPEEDVAPASEHADSFEEDFARYLSALGSSLPQRTETDEHQLDLA